MKVTIKLFLPGQTKPRFVGELETVDDGGTSDDTETFDDEELTLLLAVERAINVNVAGRCHIEIE